MSRTEQMEQIVNEHQYQEIDGMFVDVQSANAYMTVHRNLSESNQEHLEALNMASAMDIVWKVLLRVGL